MKITATFIGKEGSYGFHTSQTYQFRLGYTDPWALVIETPDGRLYPYVTLKLFFQNWANVSLIP